MQHFSRLNFLVIVFLIYNLQAFPQKEITLEDCIQIALERNISIKRQGLQVDLSKDNQQTTLAARLPALDGFYAHNLSSGKTVNYENYTYINTKYQDGNVGIQGSVPIFSGFGNWYLARSARLSILSETDKKAELVKALTIDVTTAFLQVLYTQELLGIAQAKLESSKEQLRMNEGYFDAGRLSKVEVLAMKAQVAQDNLAKIQAENDINTSYLSLGQLLSIDNIKELRIKKPISLNGPITLVLGNPEKILEYALTNHPGISAAGFLIQSREAQVKAMRSKLAPSVSLNGVLYSRYSELGINPLNPTADYPYSDQLKDNLYGRASINISVPIFSQFQARSRINQANIQSLDARLQLDQKKLTIRQDIQTAFTAAVNARAKYEATMDAVSSANEAFNLTQEKYKAGISSSVEFKIAQNQLVQAQLIQVQAKYEYLIRSKILDLYLDKPMRME